MLPVLTALEWERKYTYEAHAKLDFHHVGTRNDVSYKIYKMLLR